MMETYLLEQLYAVYQYETLNEAAKQLHLTQPTLTRSMQKIEKEFGIPLFQRTRNRLILNENGKLAARYAKRILDEHKKMFEAVRANASVSIGVSAPGPFYVVQDLLQTRTITKHIMNNLDLFTNLRNGTFDLVISEEKHNDLDLLCKELCTEHLYVSVSNDHPNTRFKELTYQQMNGTTFLMAENIGIWKKVVEATMPDSKYLLQDSVDALSQIVIFSTIPSFISNISYKYLHQKENRTYIPFTGNNTSFTFYLYCLREKKDMFESLFSKLPVKMPEISD